MISQRMHILPILAAQSSSAVHLDISTVVWDACSLCHQWHKPQSHNTWFQAQKIAAAAPDSNTCDFFWAGNVHFLFLGRNSAEHSSKVASLITIGHFTSLRPVPRQSHDTRKSGVTRGNSCSLLINKLHFLTFKFQHLCGMLHDFQTR